MHRSKRVTLISSPPLTSRGYIMIVEKGNLVKLHYTAKIYDRIIDSSKGEEPIEFRVGQDQVLLGLEESVLGLRKGEKKNVILPPEKTYGQRQKNLLVYAPLESLQELGKPIQKGTIVPLKSEQGEVQLATIIHASEHTVTLDLNHPLAGQTIKFELEIVDVKQ
jgi:FKBP-type peptidyl-prolyl cis-trans isomerase 2